MDTPGGVGGGVPLRYPSAPAHLGYTDHFTQWPRCQRCLDPSCHPQPTLANMATSDMRTVRSMDCGTSVRRGTTVKN